MNVQMHNEFCGDAFHVVLNKRYTTRTSSTFDDNIPILPQSAEYCTFARMTDDQKKKPAFDINKLKRAIIENTGPGRRFTRRGLSLAATEGKNPDLIRNLLNDKSKKPSFVAIAGLADAMGMDIADFTIEPMSRGGPVYLSVIGSVEAGAWREQAQWPVDEQYQVRALESEYRGLERFGLIVVGYSMDKRFLPGDVLDCIRLPFSGDTPIRPTPGQIVIAQHLKGSLCETTCKVLGREPNGDWYLMPDSSRPEHQEKIAIGSPDGDYSLDDGISIVGIVTAAIRHVPVH